MVNQQHLKPLAEETFFKDGSGARPIPPHTIARGQLNEDEQFFEGKVGGQLVTTFPCSGNASDDRSTDAKASMFIAPFVTAGPVKAMG